jgi:hypothetical protein
MSHLSDVIGPSAHVEGSFNEFLQTICVCSGCHVIDRTQVLLIEPAARASHKPFFVEVVVPV